MCIRTSGQSYGLLNTEKKRKLASIDDFSEMGNSLDILGDDSEGFI